MDDNVFPPLLDHKIHISQHINPSHLHCANLAKKVNFLNLALSNVHFVGQVSGRNKIEPIKMYRTKRPLGVFHVQLEHLARK